MVGGTCRVRDGGSVVLIDVARVYEPSHRNGQDRYDHGPTKGDADVTEALAQGPDDGLGDGRHEARDAEDDADRGSGLAVVGKLAGDRETDGEQREAEERDQPDGDQRDGAIGDREQRDRQR